MLFPFVAISQLSDENQRKVDSLKSVVENAAHDTIKVRAWKEWDDIIYLTDPEMDLALNKRIDSTCTVNLKKSNDPKSRDVFLQSKCYATNNIGIYYHEHGQLEEAMTYYSNTLKISSEIGDEKMQGGSLSNIGNIFLNQGDTTRAMEYYQKGLVIQEKVDDKNGVSTTLQNIGILHYEQKNYDEAMDYYTRSMEIKREIGNLWGVASSIINIGHIYSDLGDNETAIQKYQEALEIEREIGDLYGEAFALSSLGVSHYLEGRYEIARKYSEEALSAAQDYGISLIIRDAAFNLWSVYKAQGKFKKSLEMHELYQNTKDSLLNVENLKGVVRQEYKYQYELKSAADSINHAMQQEIAEVEISQRDEIISTKRMSQYVLVGGLIVAGILAGFLFNRFKVTSKQKEIIEDAHQELEVKNQEIVDSITYAKRIQSAVLPPDSLVKKHLQDSFILYKPKDIVAGDFYWIEQKEDKIMFAACDCTGHGVPGAMVSVFCSNGLNRAVREHGLTDPAAVLEKTRDIIIKEFEKTDEDVYDGMDIALCSLQDNNDGTKTLNYAGAYNPLWIIRNGGSEIEEIKANKQPVSRFRQIEPFKSHEVKLNKGDTVYVFTDGYYDQFGGEKNKKFKSINLAKLLVSIQGKSMEEQKSMLDRNFEDWKGEFEQIDDVCVIGVRV